jgi:hypothetical protein
VSARRISIAVLAFAVFATLAMASLAGLAGARSAASTSLTIKYNGDGFQGKVKSSASKCVKDRKVQVFKQSGSSQSPSTDKKIDTVTSDRNGHWDTGNSGQAHGRFYAYAPKKTGCRAGSSQTIKV